MARLAFDFDGKLYALQATNADPFVERRELDLNQLKVVRYPETLYSNLIQSCPVSDWSSDLKPLIYLDRGDSYCFDNSISDITVKFVLDRCGNLDRI